LEIQREEGTVRIEEESEARIKMSLFLRLQLCSSYADVCVFIPIQTPAIYEVKTKHLGSVDQSLATLSVVSDGSLVPKIRTKIYGVSGTRR